MLSITKLGIEVLSRFAKKENAHFSFKGDTAVRFFEESFSVIPQHKTQTGSTKYEFRKVYVWDCECGLVQIDNPVKVSFGLNIVEILEQRRQSLKPEFTHIAFLEDLFETKGTMIMQNKRLTVYRFIRNHYDKWQECRAQLTLGSAYRN